MRVKVSGGKYEFVSNLGGPVDILRGGRPWHTQHDASNAITNMMAELDAARVVLHVARALGDNAPRSLRLAIQLHDRLVDDTQTPSEWTGVSAECQCGSADAVGGICLRCGSPAPPTVLESAAEAYARASEAGLAAALKCDDCEDGEYCHAHAPLHEETKRARARLLDAAREMKRTP